MSLSMMISSGAGEQQQAARIKSCADRPRLAKTHSGRNACEDLVKIVCMSPIQIMFSGAGRRCDSRWSF